MGRWMEAQAKKQTAAAIKALVGLAPKTARVLRDGAEVDIPVEEVVVGDLVRVRPGEKVPVDGVVVDGASTRRREHADRREPAGRQGRRATPSSAPRSTAPAASSSGPRAVGADTTLAQIVRLVEDAQGSKAPMQRLADQVSAWFVPASCSPGRAHLRRLGDLRPGRPAGWTLAIGTTIAVLIIACPCALGLATPTAIMVGTGKAAELGILIGGGEALEQARRLTAVVLDKTGTITRGQPAVTGIATAAGWDRRRAARPWSPPPRSAASTRSARRSSPPPASAAWRCRPSSDFEAVPGHGIEATVDGRQRRWSATPR